VEATINSPQSSARETLRRVVLEKLSAVKRDLHTVATTGNPSDLNRDGATDGDEVLVNQDMA
jgi:hypothetical protein